MKIKCLFLGLLFLLLFLGCKAQILVVDQNRQASDSTKRFLGELTLNFVINNRSATEEDANRLIGLQFESDLAYVAKQHMYMLFSNLNYTYATDDPVIRTGFSHFRANFLREKFISYELFAQIQFDLGRGLQFRQLGGGDVKLRLSEKRSEDFTAFLGVGGMWEQETWKFPASDMEKTLALVKSSNFLSLAGNINQSTTAESTVYFQTGYDDSVEAFRHRVNVHAALVFGLTNVLSFEVEGSFSYENRPVVPILRYMFFFQNGIKFNF